MKVNRFSIDLNAYCGKIHCIDNFAKILRISVLPPAHTSLVWEPDARNVCPCMAVAGKALFEVAAHAYVAVTDGC